MAKVHWLLEAIDRAGPFLSSSSQEAQAFGVLLIVDKMPSEGDLALVRNVTKTGIETLLQQRRFDPVEFIESLAADQAAAAPAADAEQPDAQPGFAEFVPSSPAAEDREAAPYVDGELIIDIPPHGGHDGRPKQKL